MADDKKVYVPQQRVTRGKPGYKGGKNVVVVDRKTGEPIKKSR